jgi:hypothetical protein
VASKSCATSGGHPFATPNTRSNSTWSKRDSKGTSVSLFTNERVQSEEQAWEIFFAYKRRGPLEPSFRSGKCELAMESPRLWSLENRLKLLGIVLLVSAFLLFLLEEV